MSRVERETNTVRLSARTRPTNFQKLRQIAEIKGWINAQGHPNISRVINFVIEQFDLKSMKKKEDPRGR